jgi:hypothetical protein
MVFALNKAAAKGAKGKNLRKIATGDWTKEEISGILISAIGNGAGEFGQKFLQRVLQVVETEAYVPFTLSFSHLRKLLPKAFLRSPSRAVTPCHGSFFVFSAGITCGAA